MQTAEEQHITTGPQPAHFCCAGAAGPAGPAPLASSTMPPGAAAPSRRGSDRLRPAASTEPGRARIIVVALLASSSSPSAPSPPGRSTDRSTAADDVVNRSQPLSSDAADIYRSLADANTAASSGYSRRPRRAGHAARRTRRTSARPPPSSSRRRQLRTGLPSAKTIADCNVLPEYKGLVETARANNRQGLPVGGAYLRSANEMMQQNMLPRPRALPDGEPAPARRLRGMRVLPLGGRLPGPRRPAGLAWAERPTTGAPTGS